MTVAARPSTIARYPCIAPVKGLTFASRMTNMGKILSVQEFILSHPILAKEAPWAVQNYDVVRRSGS